jgi:hypothetical protein
MVTGRRVVLSARGEVHSEHFSPPLEVRTMVCVAHFVQAPE